MTPQNRMSEQDEALDALLQLLADRAAEEWLRSQNIPITTKAPRHDTRMHLRSVQHRSTN